MTTQARARATLLVNKLIPINFRLMGACLKIRIGPFRRLAAVRNHNCRWPEWRTNFLPLWRRPEFSAESIFPRALLEVADRCWEHAIGLTRGVISVIEFSQS